MRTVLVDCRPEAAHLAGHPPGARHADPERDLSAPVVDPAVGGRHPLPSDGQLAELFGVLGIDDETFVLALDAGTGWAARCWWLLRHLGHDAAGTLDLRTYAGPLEQGLSPQGQSLEGQSLTFTPRPRSDDLIDAEEIRARLGDPDLVLLDARAPERWLGEVEPLDPVKGRIPGALNAHFADPVPANLPDEAELAAYCGSGVTACVIAQKLVLAGRDSVRMYPGSFSEWCRRPDYPIETGAPR